MKDPREGTEHKCDTCNGFGYIQETNCCGVAFYYPEYPDNDLCTACGEHAVPEECDDCLGSGMREMTIEEEYDLEEAEAENKGDEMRGG
jgi:primosomal protein N'